VRGFSSQILGLKKRRAKLDFARREKTAACGRVESDEKKLAIS
jgi:hypothetical protein